MTRRELSEIATALRAEGAYLSEIAELLGISQSHASALICDPDDVKGRARKAKACGVCRSCGATTSYRTGGPSTRCPACASIASRIWTADMLIAAIQSWNAIYGEPPGAMDWNRAHARRNATPERSAVIEERWNAGAWPYANTVQRVFGSWNAGIQAAGFTPLPTGKKRHQRHTSESHPKPEEAAA